MGSGTSRGKRVAPARVSDGTVKPAPSVTSSKPDDLHREPLKVRALLRNERSRRAQPPECHSDGHDSDFSAEDDEGEGDAAADVAERERTPPPRKMKPRTYGLCHFSREDAEDDVGSAPRLSASDGAEGPRGSRGGSGGVNSGSNDAFTHFKKHSTQCPGLNSSSTQGFMRGTLLEAVPTPEKQASHSSSLTMPVILYDGSEEELMDTIEREFS